MLVWCSYFKCLLLLLLLLVACTVTCYCYVLVVLVCLLICVDSLSPVEGPVGFDKTHQLLAKLDIRERDRLEDNGSQLAKYVAYVVTLGHVGKSVPQGDNTIAIRRV